MFQNDIIEKIRGGLIARAQSLAVAESVTSGYLQLALSTAVDAMKFYQGGITAYNIGQKAKHLNVDPIRALNCNCVSQQIAEVMSTHVCHMFNSNWGIGTTGYASPIPESGNTQFAWFAICHEGVIKLAEKIELHTETPLEAQLAYTNIVLDKLAVLIESTEVYPHRNILSDR